MYSNFFKVFNISSRSLRVQSGCVAIPYCLFLSHSTRWYKFYAGIVTSFAAGESLTHHPVIQSLNELRAIASSPGPLGLQELSEKQPSAQDVNGYKNINPTLIKIVEALDSLFLECTAGGLDNASISIKNGGVELVTSVCETFKTGGERLLTSSLEVWVWFCKV